MSEQTICGVALSLFARPPTPQEMAAAMAFWPSTLQAAFFSALGEQLNFHCGSIGKLRQWQSIVDSLIAEEEGLCSGYGSELIRELADRLADKREI